MSTNPSGPTLSTGDKAPRVMATNENDDRPPTVRRDTPPTKAEAEQSSASSEAASAGVKEASMSRSEAPAPQPRETRHAHLFVTHLDPWSVMKNSFMLSIAIGVVMIVAVTVLWAMLSASGTLDSITSTVSDVAGDGPQAIDARELFSFSRVVGTTAILALLEVILVTALVTLFAFLYNLAVGITGGLQVTLTDDS